MPTNSSFVVEFDGGAPVLTDSQIGALLKEHTAFKAEIETLKCQNDQLNQMGKALAKGGQETIQECFQLKKENEKLKEENEAEVDRRSEQARTEVVRMCRLSGLAYDIEKDRGVNLNLMDEKIEKLKKQNETLRAVVEERTTENDNLKEEVAGLVVEEERVGEEASVLADNCERLLCAIHGKEYSETDYAFGAEECSEVSVIEEAIAKISKKDDQLDKAEKEIMELEKEIDWRVRDALEDKAELSEKVFAAEEVLDHLGYKWSEEYGGYSCETEEEEKEDEEWLEEFSDEPLSQTKKAAGSFCPGAEGCGDPDDWEVQTPGLTPVAPKALPYLEEVNNFNPLEFWYCRERWNWCPSWSLKDETLKRSEWEKKKSVGRNTLPTTEQKNEAHKWKMVEEGVSEEGDYRWRGVGDPIVAGAHGVSGGVDPRDNYCVMFYRCFRNGHQQEFVRGQKGVFLESMKFYHKVNCDTRYRNWNLGMRKGTKVKMALVNKEL